ncbi:MAG: ABC transporter permease subunit [Gaiellales bacterium]
MATLAEPAAPGMALEHQPKWLKPAAILLVIVGMWGAYRLWRGEYPWPAGLRWDGLSFKLDEFQTWLIDERTATDRNLVFDAFEGLRSLLDNFVEWLFQLFRWLTWPGVTAIGTLLVAWLGGLRVAAITLAAFAVYGATGLWAESMETFALMIVAVGISLAIGIPLGVAAGRSERVNRVLSPLLDAAQIIPAFAYLMPVVLLFSVGYAAAVVTTMVYAIPPAVRITALGIRGVPTNSVEAASSLGATRAQTLFKVQLPLARRLLLLGVNQTILFALSMVVIAGLIGGGGLGAVVNSGLSSNASLALLAGLVIVVMAVAVDRTAEAVAVRTDPVAAHRQQATKRQRRILGVGALAAGAIAVLVSKLVGAAASFPLETAGGRTTTLQYWLVGRFDAGFEYVRDPLGWVFGITNPTGTFILVHLLQPLQRTLMEGPWLTTLAGLTLIAFVLSGLRPALTALLMLGLIGFVGQSSGTPVWTLAMDTLSQVLVATAIAVLIGIALGIAAAESRVVSRVLRPVNDVLQTLPQLVYIIPFIYLMPVSIVPGIVAGVLYAFPVVVRLVERGLQDVAPQSVEAAAAFGATRGQILRKVKIPLAGDAIMLGVNQGIVMVLAVVVIGGLVGSGGLGYEVAQGLVRGQFGQGVITSFAILALGIALDRVTQGSRSRDPA